MQSRNGESSRLGNAPGGDAVHADSPPDQQVNGLVPGPRPGQSGESTQSGQSSQSGQSGQSGQPARPEPPDRPRPREPGPPPPVPSKLPKRTPDASRPSVPPRGGCPEAADRTAGRPVSRRGTARSPRRPGPGSRRRPG